MNTQVSTPPSPSFSQHEGDRYTLVLLALDAKSPLSLLERWGLIVWLGGSERTGLW